MKGLNTLVIELRKIALDSGANDLQLIATDIIKTAAWAAQMQIRVQSLRQAPLLPAVLTNAR